MRTPSSSSPRAAINASPVHVLNALSRQLSGRLPTCAEAMTARSAVRGWTQVSHRPLSMRTATALATSALVSGVRAGGIDTDSSQELSPASNRSLSIFFCIEWIASSFPPISPERYASELSILDVIGSRTMRSPSLCSASATLQPSSRPMSARSTPPVRSYETARASAGVSERSGRGAWGRTVRFERMSALRTKFFLVSSTSRLKRLMPSEQS